MYSTIIDTNFSKPTLSSSSKCPNKGLSISSTPINLLSLTIGTTISELEAESQAICPGNSYPVGTVLAGQN